MSTAITVEDVLRLFQETDRKMNWILETMNERSKEIDRQMQETDRRMQETDRQLQETDRKLKETARMVDNLTSKWGRFLEGLVAPSCETIFQEWGVPVHDVSIRVRVRRDDGRTMEIDVLVVNGNSVVLVEVKSTLSVEDVRHQLDAVAQFKDFFPRYRDYRIMGAVIGITSDEHAEIFAERSGLFVLGHSGNIIRIANSKNFQPKTW